MSFELHPRYTLEPWQRDARDAWLNAHPPRLGPRHGILEIYTGAGKTVVALGAMAELAHRDPDLRFAVVAPTVALAQQWVDALCDRTTLSPADVGQVGGDRDDDFARRRVLVYVLASARADVGGRSRLARDTGDRRLVLIVDECHKAGAPSSSKIFDAPAVARLGLSATPLREGADAQDDLGRPLPLDQQPHGRALGPVCFQLGLREGVARGLLPRYEIHHHGVSLTPAETRQHDDLIGRVRSARQAVTRAGGAPDAYLSYLLGRGRATPALRSAALALQAVYFERKQFLYAATERTRVVARILTRAWTDHPPHGAILFNERIGEDDDEASLSAGAEGLCRHVKELAAAGTVPFPPEAVEVEHSGRSAAERAAALAGLRDGRVQVLVSVKALQEGIDIPDVELGISVASTASARQRIQTLGRILRPARDAQGRRIPADQAPVKRLHLLYVRGTVDEEIYKRTDWNDETGEDRNRWWTWGLEDEAPQSGEELAPTEVGEDLAWSRIEGGRLPAKWEGPDVGVPLVHKQGGVFVITGGAPRPVNEAKQLIAQLERGKERGVYRDARGGFKVTPEQHVVLKRVGGETWALGRLQAAPTWSDEPVEAPAPVQAKSGTWFVVLQEGFLAAVQGDRETLAAARAGLAGPKRAWAAEALRLLEEGAEWPAGAVETVPTKLDALLPFAARAYAGGRLDVVRRAASNFKAGAGGKPKRVAAANALAILAGTTTEVWRPEE